MRIGVYNASTSNEIRKETEMSNVDRVKQVLKKVNSNFTSKDAQRYTEDLTVKQVGEALKGVKYVQSRGNGKFRVRGRKVG